MVHDNSQEQAVQLCLECTGLTEKTMINAKQAVQRAKEEAIDMLSQRSYSLEEIERETYQGKDVWSITLSFEKSPEETPSLKALANAIRPEMNYKRILIDAETGDFVAIKIRELAAS